MMEVFVIREEIEEAENEEDLNPIQMDIESKYADIMDVIKSKFFDTEKDGIDKSSAYNENFVEIAEDLKQAKYWSKIIDEIDLRRE